MRNCLQEKKRATRETRTQRIKQPFRHDKLPAFHPSWRDNFPDPPPFQLVGSLLPHKRSVPAHLQSTTTSSIREAYVQSDQRLLCCCGDTSIHSTQTNSQVGPTVEGMNSQVNCVDTNKTSREERARLLWSNPFQVKIYDSLVSIHENKRFPFLFLRSWLKLHSSSPILLMTIFITAWMFLLFWIFPFCVLISLESSNKLKRRIVRCLPGK